MKTKILFSLLLISAVVLIACKKSKEVSAAPPPSEESLLKEQVITEARLNLKSVVSENAFNDLDWENAVVTKQKGSGNIAVIKSRRNVMDSLVYVTAGNMKIYQWAGEVHTLRGK